MNRTSLQVRCARRCKRSSVALFLFSATMCAQCIAESRITFDTLVENVAASEQVYRNLDVRISETYQHFDTTTGSGVSAGFERITSSSERTHVVQQSGMFLVNSRRTSLSVNKREFSVERTRIFDLQQTQLLEVPSTGKPGPVDVIDGRADDEKVLHPHMLLMRHTRQVIPLSIYMKGDSAIKAYPYGRVPEGMHVDVQYLGKEVREDLLCHVIWITNEFNESKEPHDRRIVWLAEDRNYLPVHQEAYTFRFSERIPVGESSILEWEQLKPGIWFPRKSEVVGFDKLLVKKSGEKKPLWQRDYKLTDISLTPNYPLSYFAELDVPDGS